MDSIHVYKLLLGFFTPAARAQATEYTRARSQVSLRTYRYTAGSTLELELNLRCFVIAFSFVTLARTVRLWYDV